MDVTSCKPGCVPDATRFFTSGARLSGQGFTLIELLVVLAIFIILLSYAIPAFRDFIDRQRQITHLNTLVFTLYLARNEALTRNRDVMVCKSSDGYACITNGEWEQGWIVFEDRNGNRLRDENEVVLSRQERLSGVTLYYRAFGSNHYIFFNARGTTNTNGTYTFCNAGGTATARALIVSKIGRPRSSVTASDGSPLTCPP